MSLFIKCNCGCVGIPTGEKNERGEHILLLLEHCDHTEGELDMDAPSFFFRAIENYEPATPLTDAEVERLVVKVRTYINWGMSFKMIQRLLQS